jgi:hypothetical protein
VLSSDREKSLLILSFILVSLLYNTLSFDELWHIRNNSDKDKNSIYNADYLTANAFKPTVPTQTSQEQQQ